MKEKWNEDNPDEPYSRREELQTGRYELNKWLIRVNDEGKVLAVIGWKEYPNHTVVGGGLTTSKGKEIKGNMIALMESRKAQLPQDNMMITALVHQSGSNERWLGFGKRIGFAFPNDSRFEEYANQLPQEVKDDWVNAYPKTFGVKPVNPIADTEELNKAYDDIGDWFSVTKNERYVRTLTGRGYDVMDTQTGKRVNTRGLSKSGADAMILRLTPWKRTLQKYLPDSSFEHYSIEEPVAELGTRDRFKDKTIQSLGNADHQAFITEQYLRQVSDRLPDATNSLMDKWLDKLNALSLSKGKYWFFGTNVYEDKTYVMINVINKGDRYLDTGKKFNLQDMDSAIIFMGVSKSMVGKIKHGERIPKGRKFIDLWGKGGVRGLQKKPTRRFPKEPVNIFKWQDVLKIDPNSGGYKALSFTGRNHDGGENNFMGKVVDGVAVIFNSYYHYSYKQRKKISFTNLTDALAREYIALAAGLGQWSYINDDAKDKSLVIFDRLTKPTDVIKNANGKQVKDIGNDPATGLPITEAVVFHHIDAGDQEHKGEPSKRDIFYTGIKPNHPQKATINQQAQMRRGEPNKIVPMKYGTTKKPTHTNHRSKRRSPNQQRRGRR